MPPAPVAVGAPELAPTAELLELPFLFSAPPSVVSATITPAVGEAVAAADGNDGTSATAASSSSSSSVLVTERKGLDVARGGMDCCGGGVLTFSAAAQVDPKDSAAPTCSGWTATEEEEEDRFALPPTPPL